MTSESTTDWWKGDGRAEHVLDVALPHEDHDEDPDFHIEPGPGSTIATVLVAVACVASIVAVLAIALAAWT